MGWKRVQKERHIRRQQWFLENRRPPNWKWDKSGTPPLSSRPKQFSDVQLLADDKTQTIRRFVEKNASEPGFVNAITQLAARISQFEFAPVDYAILEKKWSNRRASEVIREQQLLTAKATKRPFQPKVWGCMDAAVALAASAHILAKIRQVPAKIFFVRYGTHAYVRIQLDEQDMLIDPTFADDYDLTKPKNRQIVAKLKQKKIGSGIGPRAIGLNSIRDFYKYAVRKKKGK